MKKSVLLIAFHFPPFRGNSGLLRTLNFSRYLPQFGWEPIVLTAHPRAYTSDVDPRSMSLIPPHVSVTRAFALDAARHFSWRGKHFGCTAIPDRWGSWMVGAIPAALRLVRQWKPCAIWSTYPIVTAHVIGAIVQRLTGLPWIADFRDPMVEYDPVTNEYWPQEPMARTIRMHVERLVVKYSTRIVFVTPGALDAYAQRFPTMPKDRLTVIPNGYDEENFAVAERIPFVQRKPSAPLTLLHSGGLYPESGRDTTSLFAAVVDLRQHGGVTAEDLRIVLRASFDEINQQRLIKQYGLEDLVFLAPPIPYVDALAEMLQADGLLLFQGPLTNTQIPAKLYEYLRARRPIFAVVDPIGDTGALLRSVGVGTICPVHDKDSIAKRLSEFLTQIRLHAAPVADPVQIARFSRQASTGDFARLLDEVRSS
jgi:glycosyltransferase involved in cell wall biosynthesis